MPVSDTLSRILFIDLSHRKYHVENRTELFEKALGGAGVAIQLLHELCPVGADALGPNNPIILAVGPLTALYPLASKTVAMFKSPHTGNLGESHCGGRSAISIRLAGYGALVITGASDMPIYLAIDSKGVHFRDATTLWGMSRTVTAGRIIREQEEGAGMRSIMRIGSAGENMVSYACVTTETYRHFGRLGLGAVFGSKKLKAILITGKRSIPVANKKEYRKLYDEIYKKAVSPDFMRKYHDLGTAANILPLNGMGGLPTRNLTSASFEHADKISGENLAENYLGRRLACAHCPVGCIHIAALREAYEDEAYFYKTSMISYDYEPIFAIGSLLGGSDIPGFLKLMDLIEMLGVDVMSAGVVLAWATEAFEKGLINTEHTIGIQLSWGDYDAYQKAMQFIVKQPNEFYRTLARGVSYASKKYGGEEYALAFGKNEMPGYHTGPAAHLGFLIGTRHSHLDNAGYSVDQKVLTKKSITAKALSDSLIIEEQWRQILSSLVICFFARKIYDIDTVQRALKTAGFVKTKEEILKIASFIYYEKYRFKFKEGFSLDDMQIPKRIFETKSLNGKIDENYLRKALAHTKKTIDSALDKENSD